MLHNVYVFLITSNWTPKFYNAGKIRGFLVRDVNMFVNKSTWCVLSGC